MKKFLFLIALLFISNSCSKDDICDPEIAVTPLLIITFKNFENRDLSKAVPNLIVTTNYNPSEEIINTTSVDSIAIPLRTAVGDTSYQFTSIDTSIDTNITDVYDFTYGREDIYVNRACGFKTIFTNFIATENEEDPANDVPSWILELAVQQINIENEIQAHITIFH